MRRWPSRDGWRVVGMVLFKVGKQRRDAMRAGFAQHRNFFLALQLVLPVIDAGGGRQQVDAGGQVMFDQCRGELPGDVLIGARAVAQPDGVVLLSVVVFTGGFSHGCLADSLGARPCGLKPLGLGQLGPWHKLFGPGQQPWHQHARFQTLRHVRPDLYQQRSSASRRALGRASGIFRPRHHGLGVFRLVLVGLAIWVVVSLLSQPPWWGWLLLALLAGGFLGLGLFQQIRDDRRLRAKALAEWHLEGARRCRGESLGKAGRGRDGSDQLDGWHPFARDLDVCGPGGLIQRLNTGLSRAGYQTLCAWCLQPERAPAVAEARPRIAALQSRLALRADLGIQAHVRGAGGLDGGVNDSQVVAAAAGLGAPPAWLPLAAWVMRLIALAVLVALAMQSGAAGLWLGGLVAAVLGFPLDAWVASQLGKAGDPIKLARAATAWREAMLALRRETGDDPHLSTWRTQADEAIAGCTHLAAWAEARVRRGNPMWQGLSAILQAQSFAWRGPLPTQAMQQWTELLAEIEAVSCLATWAAERGGVMPEEAEAATIIDAEDLAHPLIAADVRVGNDIVLKQHQVFLVTGANASGNRLFCAP